jgi:hypothetical protein
MGRGGAEGRGADRHQHRLGSILAITTPKGPGGCRVKKKTIIAEGKDAVVCGKARTQPASWEALSNYLPVWCLLKPPPPATAEDK